MIPWYTSFWRILGAVFFPSLSRKGSLWEQLPVNSWGSVFSVMSICGILIWIILVGSSLWYCCVMFFICVNTGFAEKLVFINFQRGLRSLSRDILWETCSCGRMVAVWWTGWQETEELMKLTVSFVLMVQTILVESVASQKQGLCSWLWSFSECRVKLVVWFVCLCGYFLLDRLISATGKPKSELRTHTFFLQVQRKVTVLLKTIHLSSGWMFLPPGTNAFP